MLPQEIIDIILFLNYENYNSVIFLNKRINSKLRKCEDYIVYNQIQRLNINNDIMQEYLESKQISYIPSCISNEYKLHVVNMLIISCERKRVFSQFVISFSSVLNFYQFMERYTCEDENFLYNIMNYTHKLLGLYSDDAVLYPFKIFIHIMKNTSIIIDVQKLRDSLENKPPKIQEELLCIFLLHREFILSSEYVYEPDEITALYDFINKYSKYSIRRDNNEEKTIHLNKLAIHFTSSSFRVID